MTEQRSDEETVIEAIEADPHGRLELALAHFSLRLEELFAAAVSARPEVTLDELASLTGVDFQRVQRLLEGEDVLPAEAFVRYVRALGYAPIVNIVPVDAGTPQLPQALFEWDSELVDTYSQSASDGDGVHELRWTRSRTFTVGRLEALEDLRYIQTIDSGRHRVFIDDRLRQPIVEVSQDDLVADDPDVYRTVFSRA